MTFSWCCRFSHLRLLHDGCNSVATPGEERLCSKFSSMSLNPREVRETSLDQFVLQQRSGGQYDSSDVFTIDTLEMGRKMAAFQLPERGLWLVKMIQAAVRMEAGEAQVNFSRRTLGVRFRTPRRGPDARAVFEAVFQPDPNQSVSLAHLSTGLRSCLGFRPQKLSLDVRGPEGGAWYQLHRQSTESGQSPASSDGLWEYRFELSRAVERPAFKKALRHRVVDLVREVGEEYQTVVSRCWCAPLSLEIDGVDLETSLPHPAMRHLSDCRLVDCGVDRYAMGDHWLALRPLKVTDTSTDFPAFYLGHSPEGEEIELTTRVRNKECFLSWPRAEGSNAQLLVSFASLAVPGVDFIHDGVLVDQVDFPYSRPLRPLDRLTPVYQRQAVGFRLFVCVDSNQLDLSGFGVREKEALAADLYLQIRNPLLHTLAQLESLADNYRFSAYRPKSIGRKARLFDRMLAPLTVINHSFTVGEIKRTLAQLKHFVQKAPSRQEMF